MSYSMFGRRYFLHSSVLVVVAMLLVVLSLTGCLPTSSENTSKPVAKKTDELTTLTYVNKSAPFDYQQKMLSEGQSVRQYEYALFEQESIVVQEDGAIAFSATGPGFTLKPSSSDGSSQTIEEPMKVVITGKIDKGKFFAALQEKDGATVIGEAMYSHTADGSRKDTFSGGDYEMAEYTQKVEQPLQILYIANRDIVVLSSQGAFVVSKVGNYTSSYSGIQNKSEYKKEDSMNLYLEFEYN